MLILGFSSNEFDGFIVLVLSHFILSLDGEALKAHEAHRPPRRNRRKIRNLPERKALLHYNSLWFATQFSFR